MERKTKDVPRGAKRRGGRPGIKTIERSRGGALDCFFMEVRTAACAGRGISVGDRRRGREKSAEEDPTPKSLIKG